LYSVYPQVLYRTQRADLCPFQSRKTVVGSCQQPFSVSGPDRRYDPIYGALFNDVLFLLVSEAAYTLEIRCCQGKVIITAVIM
jgi:hypothetical protein